MPKPHAHAASLTNPVICQDDPGPSKHTPDLAKIVDDGLGYCPANGEGRQHTLNAEYHTDVPLTELGPPEFVEIEPIHSCNLRCVMCHVSYEKLSKKRIDPSFIERMVGMQGKWAVIGGEYEPMAHPQITRIIRGLSDRGMKIDLTSNGTLFTDQVNEEISRCRICRVTISFDGARKETYEKIRRRASYDQAVHRIISFKDAVRAHNPNAYFAINYTVLKDNLAEMADAVEFWEGHGFNHIGFIAMVVRSDTDYLNDQSVVGLMDDFRRQIDKIAELIISRRYVITSSNSLGIVSDLQLKDGSGVPCIYSENPKSVTPVGPRTVFQRGYFPGMNGVECRSPFKAVRLSYDGTLLICSKFPIGNIHENRPFLDIWYGAQATRFRDGLRRSPDACYSCGYFRFCINAGKIDYEKPENFRYITGSSEPMTYSMPGGWVLLVWIERFYLLPPGTTVFDPRFDELTEANGIRYYTSPEERDMALTEIVNSMDREQIHRPSNRYDFWRFGNDISAFPKGTYEDGRMRIIDPSDTHADSSLERLLYKMGIIEHAPMAPPVLVDSVERYNIIFYDGRFIGIPQSAGGIEVDKVDLASVPGLIVGDTLDSVSSNVRANQPPFLAGSVREYNIIRYRGQYIGIPQSAGAIEVDKVDLASIPGTFIHHNYDNVVSLINASYIKA